MKILFGMPEKTAPGGINACEPPFMRALEKLGVEVHEKIYSFDNPKGISNARRAANVLKTARRWRRILERETYDLIHLNTAFDKNAVLRDAFVLSFLNSRRTKVFLKFHGSDAKLLKTKSTGLSFLQKRLFEKCDAIGVLSLEEKENFIRAGVNARKIFVVKNAVELPTAPVAHDFESSPFNLLFVSRLIKTKGLFETIRACRILKEKNINFQLNVLGGGEIFEEAKALAAGENLSDLVIFHGHVAESEVSKFYRQSELLVFPTYHEEGFPMVIFNALASGLPVVTTQIRAAADYLKDEENCLFCEARNPADVAAQIEKMYLDRALMRKMSVSNMRLAAQFSAEKIAPEYLEIYRQIVNLPARI